MAFAALQGARAGAPVAPALNGISLISVPGPVSPVEQPAVFRLAAIDVDVPPPALDGPADTVEPSAEGMRSAGSDCDLTAAVQKSLRASEAVRAAIGVLTASDRSAANAVMLWDGRWVDGASPAAEPALAQIRAVVAATVHEASADCLKAPQTGPRLFAIAGPPDTVLALGSGHWRWGDLASP